MPRFEYERELKDRLYAYNGNVATITLTKAAKFAGYGDPQQFRAVLAQVRPRKINNKYLVPDVVEAMLRNMEWKS